MDEDKLRALMVSTKDDFPKIPGYEISSILGQGGMGRVYAATRNSDGRQVAIKVILPSFSGTIGRQFHQRFLREIDVCKRFNHPNVVTILDGGVVSASGEPFFVMELLSGQALDGRADFGGLSEEMALSIIKQVCAAFDYYHRDGFVHRDIKPSNIFIADDGRVVLLDFGLVFDSSSTRLTATGEAPGTALTMAPEQWAGDDMSAATDMWQLGVTLYIALTDELPYEPRDVMQMALGAKMGHPRPLRELRPDLSQKVEQFLMRCLEPIPAERFTSSKEVEQFLADDESSSLDETACAETVEISKPTFPSQSVATQSLGTKILPYVIGFLLALFSFFAWTRYKAQVPVLRGHSARSINEDISVLTASLLAEKDGSNEEDHKVLGELLFLAGHHRSKNMDHGARGLFHLIEKVQDERTFTLARLYVERYGYPQERKLGVALLQAFGQHCETDQKTDEFRRLVLKLLAKVTDEQVALDMAFYLGQHLVKDYQRRIPKDIVDREITGHFLLAEKVDPLLDEACDLIGKCVAKGWKGVEPHKLYYWYFESLHALRVRKRQDEAMRCFAKLVQEPFDEEAMAPVFQLAASLCTLRMRDFDLMERHKVAERAIPTLKKLIASYGAIHWRTLFETYLLWALLRAQKKVAAKTLADELRPERLALRQRWRYYWVVGEVFKDRGEGKTAIRLFKEGASVATGKAEQKYLKRKPHDMWTEGFGEGDR
jgi:serine/threonine protein kinase